MAQEPRPAARIGLPAIQDVLRNLIDRRCRRPFAPGDVLTLEVRAEPFVEQLVDQPEVEEAGDVLQVVGS